MCVLSLVDWFEGCDNSSIVVYTRHKHKLDIYDAVLSGSQENTAVNLQGQLK